MSIWPTVQTPQGPIVPTSQAKKVKSCTVQILCGWTAENTVAFLIGTKQSNTCYTGTFTNHRECPQGTQKSNPFLCFRNRSQTLWTEKIPIPSSKNGSVPQQQIKRFSNIHKEDRNVNTQEIAYP